MEFWVEFWNNLKDTSLFEAVSVILGLIYVILAAKEKIACWIFAFVGSCTAIKISFDANLYVDCVLNFVYALMAVVGWLEWKRRVDPVIRNGVIQNEELIDTALINSETRSRTWKFRYHVSGIAAIVVAGLITGYFLDRFTDQAFPYIDSVIFYASLLATWMITQKIIENWLYLAVVDFVCVFLYYNRGYAMVCVLFALYTVLAIWGYMEWGKERKRQDSKQ